MTSHTLAMLEESLEEMSSSLSLMKASVNRLNAERAEKMSRKSLKKAAKKNEKRDKVKHSFSPERTAAHWSFSHLESPMQQKKDSDQTLFIVGDCFGSASLAAMPFKDVATAKQQIEEWDAVLLAENGWVIEGDLPESVWAVVSKSVLHGIWASCVGVFEDKTSAVEMARKINAELDAKTFQAIDSGYEISDEDDYLEYIAKEVFVE